MDAKEIEKLADLARIQVSEEEKQGFLEDMKAILEYVSEIQKVSADELKPEAGELRNVFREDENPHPAGAHTDDILKVFPNEQNGYLKVKKIL